ncbi:MAG: heme-dependent oxidative N-demethylase family protein [Asticcacaulis sp.]
MQHAPFDGSSKPFTIGLKPLDPAEWIVGDGRLRDYLDEKDRLFERVPEQIFAAEPGSLDVQREVLEMLSSHLPAHYPDIYRHDGRNIDILPAFRRIALDSPLPPLLTAASLVQEDLVILQKDELEKGGHWRLTAASLCFPSSWRLADKFGKPLHQVHAPVPQFNEGMRNASMIERIFDNLRPDQPVIRWNWSIHDDDALFHPPTGKPYDFTDGAYLRLERQTLRKLPLTGAILFTIRVQLDPLEAAAADPDVARALGHQLAALDAAQLDYKGLTEQRDHLLARVAAI